eukprot:COSAG05_NODE_11598_length_505_cov_22.647783_1_plen_22_part_10
MTQSGSYFAPPEPRRSVKDHRV